MSIFSCVSWRFKRDLPGGFWWEGGWVVSWNFGIIKKHTFLPQYQKSKCLSVSEKNESPKGFAILYIHAPFWHNFDFSHYDKSVPNCLNMKKTLYKKTMSPLILHFMALPPLSVPTPHMIHTNQLLICATVQLMRQMDFPYYMKFVSQPVDHFKAKKCRKAE